ncbi:hypothetical protein BX666DRAFT_2043070 [Dichotomocladium elegans]|nr:hypothetical protein BX666DRAFT_2043070 [Dichotomocladium elegans]
MYILNLGSKQWSRVHMDGHLPVERSRHSAIMVDGLMYVWGGQRAGRYLNDMFVFNTNTYSSNPQWEFVMPNNEGPSARAGHVSVTFDNKLYIFGGTDGDHLYNDIWSFDLQTRLWAQVPAVGYIPVPRTNFSSALVDGVLYIFGGCGPDGQDLGDLCAFRIKSQRWYMFQNMGPAPSARYGLSISAMREKIFVLGGDNSLRRLDDSSMAYILDCSKIRYPPETAPQPSAPPPPPQQQQQQQYPQNSPQPQTPSPQFQQQHHLQHQQYQEPPANASPSANSFLSTSESETQARRTTYPVFVSQYHQQQQQSGKPRHTSVVPEAARRRTRTTSPMPFVDVDTNTDMRQQGPMSPSSINSSENEKSGSLRGLPDEERTDEIAALTRELKTREMIVAEMRKKEQWWRTEVSIARKIHLMDFDENKYPEKYKLFDQLVLVKAELRRVKQSIVHQAQPMSQKVEQADRMRIAALQEAAYFKAKYQSLKTRQPVDPALENDRTQNLEKRLASALAENESNSRLLQQLQQRAQHDHSARLAAEERAKEAHERAQEAQEAHQRALEELANVHDRAIQAEAQARESTLKVAELTQQLAQALESTQDVSEAHILVSRLEAANLKARNEVASLKQKLAESQDDMARLRTILSEREETFKETTRELEDAEIQLGMMRDAMHRIENSAPSPPRGY